MQSGSSPVFPCTKYNFGCIKTCLDIPICRDPVTRKNGGPGVHPCYNFSKRNSVRYRTVETALLSSGHKLVHRVGKTRGGKPVLQPLNASGGPSWARSATRAGNQTTFYKITFIPLSKLAHIIVLFAHFTNLK